jgi:type II secretory pathway pseudopilin PulG
MSFSKQGLLGVKKMKSIIKQSDNKAAFTIVELLTVMSIIVILIGLLVPALNKVKDFAREVKQRAQFHSIDAAIELFSTQFDGLPNSSATGPDNESYCGAMKLAEAMVGQDLMGFHPDSVFNSNGQDLNKNWLYDPAKLDRSARKGPYLPVENSNAYKMNEIYDETNIVNKNFLKTSLVLCDVFRQVSNKSTGQKIGMPILYYKANPAKLLHDSTKPALSIYNYLDNADLVTLGRPFDDNAAHRLADNSGERFYINTKNTQVTTTTMPYNKDTYILISAGTDGEYGTSDDICNFDFKYQQ